MIKIIEIKYKNNFIVLDRINKVFVINKIKKEFDEKLFSNLLNTISLWKHEYINNEIIDGFSFIIDIYFEKTKERILIKNEFPSNFQEFLNIIGEL